jgi:hypothetical protein
MDTPLDGIVGYIGFEHHHFEDCKAGVTAYGGYTCCFANYEGGERERVIQELVNIIKTGQGGVRVGDENDMIWYLSKECAIEALECMVRNPNGRHL